MPNEAMTSLFVVSAPSGAGKSSVIEGVLGRVESLRFSVSHTTRSPRGTERDGVAYHFVSRPAFEGLVAEGRMIEWAEVHGQLKGTSHAELDRASEAGADLLLDIDVQGAAQVRAKVPEATSIFILPPSFGILAERLRQRGLDDDAEVGRRLRAARREMEAFVAYDYAVVNDDLGRCIDAVEAIIRAGRCRTRLMASAAARIIDTFRQMEGEAQ
jgi:guanylate kinase